MECALCQELASDLQQVLLGLCFPILRWHSPYTPALLPALGRPLCFSLWLGSLDRWPSLCLGSSILFKFL